MTSLNHQSRTQLTPADNEAITHLKEAIAGGKHWYLALLEAIGLWATAEETHNGRTYCYLIAGEAFDWLLLAERLCKTINGLIPEDEKQALLFRCQPPLEVAPRRFKELIGASKYKQYLNYYYGIVVEQALIQAIADEVRKERWIAGYRTEPDMVDEAYQRTYGTARAALLKRFRHDKGYPQLKCISLGELKEFTYWLFKYRLENCDKARVASDTRKALDWLRQQPAFMPFAPPLE